MSLVYGNKVTREIVNRTFTPDPNGAHYPIAHGFFVDAIEKALIDAGFKIELAEFVLSRNFPSKEELAAFETQPFDMPEGVGQRLFGGFALTREDLVGTERQLVCGLRNSHDKSFKSAICIGSRMMVCSNLQFSSERTIGRKHTRNIERDLPSVISKLVYGLVAEWSDMETRIKAYKLVFLNRETAADLCMKLVEHGALPKTQAHDVFQLFLDPRPAAKGMIDKESFIDENDSFDEDAYKAALAHKEHELASAFGMGNSLWGLHNALTERLKGSDFAKLPARTMTAQTLFDTLAGVNIESRTVFDVEENEEESEPWRAGTPVMVEGDIETREIDDEEIDQRENHNGTITMAGDGNPNNTVEEEEEEDINVW